MAPWTWLLGLLLVAQSLASSFTTMSVQGRPKADARSDVALEYYMGGFTALEAKTKAAAPCDVSNISKRGAALVKAGRPRLKPAHKGWASQKPAKLKSAGRNAQE